MSNTDPAQFLGPLCATDHPDNQVIGWSECEMRAIRGYAYAAVQRALAVQPDMIPVSAMRSIAVEAIRSLTGRPDLRGSGDRYLVDELVSVAEAAARTLAAPQQAAPATDKESLTVQAAPAEPTQAEREACLPDADFHVWWGRNMPRATKDRAWADWCAIRSNSSPAPAAEAPQAQPAAVPVTGIRDLRDAKWLDPQCADRGACQSLLFKAAAAVPAPSEHRIPGLGRMTDDDDGFITLQFVDEAAATKFMQDYAPSVDVDDMPPIAAAAVPAPAGKYSDVLGPFVALMETELHANSRKGDRPGWLSMSREVALLEIYWHTAKLSAAVKNNDAALIREHSADVANMAMMLLDVCGGLTAATPADPTQVATVPSPSEQCIPRIERIANLEAALALKNRADWSEQTPGHDGWWWWKEYEDGKPERLRLEAHGARVADADDDPEEDHEECSPQSYWQRTETKTMPGFWAPERAAAPADPLPTQRGEGA